MEAFLIVIVLTSITRVSRLPRCAEAESAENRQRAGENPYTCSQRIGLSFISSYFGQATAGTPY